MSEGPTIKTNGKEESITPIQRPSAAQTPSTDQPSTRAFPWLAVTGVVLFALLLVVFFALPRWVNDVPDEAAGSSVAAAADSEAPELTATPQLSAAEIAELKARAEAALADVLELDDRLRARSAGVWAADSYAEFDATAREGDTAFLDEDFQAANERYEVALSIGASLIEQSDGIMAAALDAGDAAIAAGNATFAMEQYRIVLGVDPESVRANAGVARAERLPEVLALIRTAEDQRRSGQPEAARDNYRAALEIDPDWQPAARALAEIGAEIASARFDRRLSEGFAALGDESYEQAVEAFTAALELRPGSQPAREGLDQAEQGLKLDAIALAEIRALAFERRELWPEAIERYTAALETDPTLAFANEGLARSRARADLDQKLVNLIDNPRLLLDDEILADARDILGEAIAIVDRGPRISGQTDRLGLLIDAATSPVSVVLQSDQLTEVTVYRVGALGTFAQKEIEVRPGTYTVVGSRAGFRDVRQTLTVLPGRPVDPLTVVCAEPI